MPPCSFWVAPDCVPIRPTGRSVTRHSEVTDPLSRGSRVGWKRSGEGRSGSERVRAEARGLDTSPRSPHQQLSKCLLNTGCWSTAGHQVMTTSYDPMLQIPNRAYVWKGKGQNCGVVSRKAALCLKTKVQEPVLAHIRPAAHNRCSWQWLLTFTVKKATKIFPWIVEDRITIIKFRNTFFHWSKMQQIQTKTYSSITQETENDICLSSTLTENINVNKVEESRKPVEELSKVALTVRENITWMNDNILFNILHIFICKFLAGCVFIMSLCAFKLPPAGHTHRPGGDYLSHTFFASLSCCTGNVCTSFSVKQTMIMNVYERTYKCAA